MERAMTTPDIERAPQIAEIPRPRPNGSYSVESLGTLVDTLMGARTNEAAAADRLEPFYSRDETPEDEPEPVVIPAPRPDGTEDITRGGDAPSTR